MTASRLPFVRSLSETIKIDPFLEAKDIEISVYENALIEAEKNGTETDKLEVAARALADVREAREEYLKAEGRASITLRILPPRVLSELRMGFAKEVLDQIESLKHSLEINRAIVRWGVVGWSLFGHDGSQIGYPDEESADGPDGRKYKVASWDVVDVLEHNGLLFAVSGAILRFNIFSGDDKKKL